MSDSRTPPAGNDAPPPTPANTAPAGPTPPAATPPAPRKQGPARMVLLLALLSIGGWLGYRYWHGMHHVTTDNAQIDGHIVPISARVSGFVRELNIEENRQVAKGDALVKIDDRDFIAKLNQAEADLNIAIASAGRHGETGQAGAQVNYAQANAAAANATIQQAEANLTRARNDLERSRSLAAKSMVSQAQLDNAEAAVRVAEAQLKTARETAQAASQQIGVSTAGLRSAQAKVDSARALRDLAANQLADTKINAPIGGVISKRAVEIGQLIQPGQTLFNIVPTDKVWVVANLKETDVSRVKVGQKAEIEVDAYPGQRFSGEVESFSPATGAKFAMLPPDNATGNFTKVVQRVPVRIRLNGVDAGKTPLRPGMSVFADILIN
ncbi:HlyD family secretion protein [Parachitinimonas caeni]|uniref:HlyD family secretion protein n=1 Tax=Parachitinimonas caeni TaxID=3031301 RepID=A0ABT7DX86_9NEIS|nr:HlyD family secretion protein [Parachitinimonas caeni]MDK2124604.1 HlyD family secretion protein [Parachitinimonas caeni]